MQKFTARLLTSALVCCAAGSALAEEKALVAECTGKGARFFLSDLTLVEAAVVAGTEIPVGPGAILVIGAGRTPAWSTAGRRQIDRDCGGRGQDEIELFPGGLQPRDGTWRTTVEAPRLEGCPQMFASAMAAGNKAPQTDTRKVTFPKPFDPNELPRDFNPGHTWRPAGDNRWTTNIHMQGMDFGASGNQKTSVDLTMKLVSETEIRQSGSVAFTLPDIAQKTLAIPENCRVITDTVSTWIGD